MLATLFVEKTRKYGIRRALALTVRYLRVAVDARLRRLRGSYSQYGEDLVVDGLLGKPRNGLYVDVGANDPELFSNTKMFYDRGWRGVNIEPNTTNHSRFVSARTRDTNLNIGVGEREESMTFYIFQPDQISTFSSSEAQKYQALGYHLVESRSVPVRPLAKVLSEHVDRTPIDFMSVDTEGYDLQVLRSNDWQRFRPRLVCVECSDHDSGREIVEIREFMETVGYRRAYFNGVNAIWQDIR